MLPFSAPSAPPPGWRLIYEKSGYVATGRYDEAVSFCKRLEKASPFVKVVRYGTSPEGRPLLVLILSRDRAFTPEAMAHSKKPLVFINNGIHSGEIEGKDADLILARDICISKTKASLLDTVNVMIVPVFSVDAHERFGKYNRINQNGPVEMGWRATSANLNLNRDYIKADTEEMQAMLRLLHTWKPDFFFDNHTTDGGDWQYDLQVGIPQAQTLADPVRAWTKAMQATVLPQVAKDGFPVSPYFDDIDTAHPEKPLGVSDFSPRYSTGYWAARNRPSMLVETHMLKPYKRRVDTTYEINWRTIAYVGAHGAALKSANRQADQAEKQTKEGQPFVLSARTTEATRPYTFLGYRYAPFQSPITGGMVSAWKHEPVNTQTTLRDQFAPALTAAAPAAYAIPPQWKEVIARLDLHGLTYTRLKHPFTAAFATTRFENISFPAAPFESRFMPTFKSVALTETRTLPVGTVLVPTAQVGAKLLLHLLEPDAPDSLVRNGFFNPIFEPKEYFEDYAMEPIARKMLAADPALQAEFTERLKDTQFANNPRARLEFFYARSPYYDARLNKYPVVRLTPEQYTKARQ